MRSVAASFSTLPAAEAALAALRGVYRLGPGRLRLATLGHASYPVHPDSIVAGSFDDSDVAGVRAVVERFGGTIVADVDTRRT